MKLKLLFLGLHLGFCFQVYAVNSQALGNGAGQNNLEQNTVPQLKAIIESNNQEIATLKNSIEQLEVIIKSHNQTIILLRNSIAILEDSLKVKEDEVEAQRKINHLLKQDAEKWATQSNALALFILKVLKGKPGPHFSIKRPEDISMLLEKWKERLPQYN